MRTALGLVISLVVAGLLYAIAPSRASDAAREKSAAETGQAGPVTENNSRACSDSCHGNSQ